MAIAANMIDLKLGLDLLFAIRIEKLNDGTEERRSRLDYRIGCIVQELADNHSAVSAHGDYPDHYHPSAERELKRIQRRLDTRPINRPRRLHNGV